MIKFLAGGIILSFIANALQANAQPGPRKLLEALNERSQHEMAPGWRNLGITHKAVVFIHDDIRKTDNGQLAVWIHNELPIAEYLEKEKTYLSRRERMLVDCKSSRIGTADQAYYAEHFARGAVVGTMRVKNVEMQEIIPDSIEELLMKTACAPKPKKATASKTDASKPDAPKTGASKSDASKSATPKADTAKEKPATKSGG